MGWTKVCESAQSRARMLADNLNHDSGNIRDRLGYARAGLSVFICVWTWSKLMTPSGTGLLVCGAVARGNMATGVNLIRYAGPRSCIRWHSDNESLFGPENEPELIVSMSLGHSVEFQVRRASWDVPSSMTLDHGDLLVMDGPAQLEYAHRTVSGLQGPWVNLTYRWVTQHIASCPLAGVVGCVLPSCVQGLAEPGSHVWGVGENNWISFFGDWSSFCQSLCLSSWLTLGFTIGGFATVVDVQPTRRCTPSPAGPCPFWARRWRLSRRCRSSKRRFFYFPFGLFNEVKPCSFYKGMVYYFCVLLSMLVSEREPTPGCYDAYSVGAPKWAFWEETRAKKT